ncbi:copper resistance protein CopC [Microbacterium hominis]|uniref:copper resistance CopC family protein n=1 Tax=Microbacterium TaxID=33882 RepID=UPI00168BBB2E|nr:MULTISPECIES: copper resistance CopC family protein [Microbacterium]QOC26560.1 copper resistance protein CopC [Microbacterium hominis]QOC27732.1 copper resistance protein CopC [Microbacterium hominis]QYF97132.1 copper resistance protein CopC [Microbacterium sp. PAMC21962]
MSSSRFRTRLRTLLLAVALAGTSVLVTALPAAAHDELLGSTPASGEALTDAPAEVTLTFSADVLTIGAAVIVADGADRDWVADAPVVRDGTVTVSLDPQLPTGGYEIRWRVVSQDGHPISGIIPFTVGGAEPLTRTPAATAPSTSTDAGTAADAQDTTAQDQGAREDQGIIRILLVGAGGAIIAVAAYAAFHFLRRKKGTSS